MFGIRNWNSCPDPTSDVKSVTFSNFFSLNSVQSFFITYNSLENSFLKQSFYAHFYLTLFIQFYPTKCRVSLGVGPGSRIYNFGSFQRFQFMPCEIKNIFAEISRKRQVSYVRIEQFRRTFNRYLRYLRNRGVKSRVASCFEGRQEQR